MDPRERTDYSAIVDRPPLKLPGGARVAVWPVFAIEVWDPNEAMPRGVLSPPGGGRYVPDIANWSWQEYGMRVGFWRVKAAFDRHGIKPSLALNASVCDAYPRIATAALEAGWEFVAHTYHQKPMHAVEDERQTIRDTAERIRAFTGSAPRGWIGPGLTETYETADTLAAEGFEYVADYLWDDEPVEVRTDSGTLVSIPYTAELNDIAILVLQNHRAEELYERTMDQFERLYEEGAERAKVMPFGVHAYLYGVPHRIKHLETMLDRIARRPGVLFWSGAQILDWYKDAVGRSGGSR